MEYVPVNWEFSVTNLIVKRGVPHIRFIFSVNNIIKDDDIWTYSDKNSSKENRMNIVVYLKLTTGNVSEFLVIICFVYRRVTVDSTSPS